MRQKIGKTLYKIGRPAINRLPLMGFRRMAIQVYGREHEDPFQYGFSRGLGLSAILSGLAVFFLGAGGKSPLMILFFASAGLVMGPFLEYRDMSAIFEKRQRETGIQFSRFASHCALFIGAGMSVRNAFIKSTQALEPSWTAEIIQKETAELQVGASLSEVASRLGLYLSHGALTAFMAVLIQLERYGGQGKVDLNREISNVWQYRRHLAVSAAKEMETKLIFPSILIFLGVMGMITAAMLMRLMTS